MRRTIRAASLYGLLSLTIGLAFVVASAIAVGYVHELLHRQGLEEAEERARLILDRNLATHAYYAHMLKPALFELTEPFVPEDYFDPTWMSSTYAVREIDRYFREISPADYYYKEAAINARTPANEADAYERAFIEELNLNPDLEVRSEVRMLDGEPYYVTLRRGEVLEESCLRCHDSADQAPGGLVAEYGAERSFGRTEGEVISAISIRVPLAEAYANAHRISWWMSGVLVVVLACLYGAQAFVYRRWLTGPLDALREKATLIATGDEHLGEAIELQPSGRELRQLIDAFNSMSANLRLSRDELESRVDERTEELALANQQLNQEVAERKQGETFLLESNERLVEALADLEAAQEELVQQERLAAVGQLTAGLAHELNNILASLRLYAEMSMRSPNLSPEVRRRLSIVTQQADEAARLVQQMLDFGRQAVLQRELMNLTPFVEEMAARLVKMLPEEIEVELDLAEDDLVIKADLERLRQAVMNLALNARDAMPEGGKLRLKLASSTGDPPRRCNICSTSLLDGWVKISVGDTGTGISAQVLPFLFEPFFTTRTPKGRGLGLAQVYGIVKQQEGHILVETAVGVGSTFTLYFPQVKTPA